MGIAVMLAVCVSPSSSIADVGVDVAKFLNAVSKIELIEYEVQSFSIGEMQRTSAMTLSDDEVRQRIRSQTSSGTWLVVERLNVSEAYVDNTYPGSQLPSKRYVKHNEEQLYYPATNVVITQPPSLEDWLPMGSSISKYTRTQSCFLPWLKDGKYLKSDEKTIRVSQYYPTNDIQIKFERLESPFPKEVAIFCSVCKLPSTVPSEIRRVVEFQEIDGLKLPYIVLSVTIPDGDEKAWVSALLIPPETVRVNSKVEQQLPPMFPADAAHINRIESMPTTSAKPETSATKTESTTRTLPWTSQSIKWYSLVVLLLVLAFTFLKYNRLALSILLTLSMLSVCGCNPGVTPPDRSRLGLDRESNEPILLQTGRHGELAYKTVRLRNFGNAAIEIGDPVASCGCAKPTIEKSFLRPGDATEVKISMGSTALVIPRLVNLTIPYTQKGNNNNFELRIPISVESIASWELNELYLLRGVEIRAQVGSVGSATFDFVQRMDTPAELTIEDDSVLVSDVWKTENGYRARVELLVSRSSPEIRMVEVRNRGTELRQKLIVHVLPIPPAKWLTDVAIIESRSSDTKCTLRIDDEDWEFIDARSSDDSISVRPLIDESALLRSFEITCVGDRKEDSSSFVVATLRKGEIETQCILNVVVEGA